MTDERNFELRVEVSLSQRFDSSRGIRIAETATLNLDGFLAAAKVLGLFHDLVESLRPKSEVKRG